jgi:hypothetical protein
MAPAYLNWIATAACFYDVTTRQFHKRFFYARSAGGNALAFDEAESDRCVFSINPSGGIMRVIMLMGTMMLASVAAFADGTANTSIVAEGAAPDGKVSLSATSVAAGVGWVWGKGQIEFKGKDRSFKISGLSIVDADVASISATGNVYNLTRLSDFGGHYTVASAGIALGGGAGASFLKNEHGVVIKLVETTQGIRLNLAGEGVNITL